MRDIILIITLIVFLIVGYFVMWLIDNELDKYRKNKFKNKD